MIPTRRDCLAGMLATACGLTRGGHAADAMQGAKMTGKIMTVLGPIPGDRLGRTLPHEHVMVDFIGADKTGPHRWNAGEVFEAMRHSLDAARAQGISGFVECTPAFLGRDVRLLRRLAEATKLHILTPTGLYKEPYLPPYAFAETAGQLADRWVREWSEGIDGTSIRPGLVKIAINPGKLLEVQRKIVAAAAQTSRRTGLAIACHSGHGAATLEAIDILRAERLDPARFVFVHADGEADRRLHIAAARAGAWIEYDSIGWRPIADHVEMIRKALGDGLEDRLLLSHDAGWYHVGEPRGGAIKPFTPLIGQLLPALREQGVSQSVIDRLTIDNPRKAFAIAST